MTTLGLTRRDLLRSPYTALHSPYSVDYDAVGAPAPSHDGLTGSFPFSAHAKRACASITVSGGPLMRVQLADITKSYGAPVVLDRVTLAVGPHARIGLVGPNGVGKSTLLRLLAGVESPDDGVVSRAPESLTVGYLEQEPRVQPGESIIATLGRRAGVLGAERELEDPP
jgi:ABC transporter